MRGHPIALSLRPGSRWALAVPAALVLAGCAGGDPAPAPLADQPERARVVRVVDGDTVIIRRADAARGTERLRYLGIDAPESVRPDAPVECFGPQASARNRALVERREVLLRFGPARRDRFGRLLAYVARASDGLDVGAELIRGGYAQPLVIAPNVAHAARYRALATRARAQRRGLWLACER